MTEQQDPLVGALVGGRYRIERRVGMGGMGTVYLAAQQSLGRSVALKVLRGELVCDPIAVERFKNEAKLIAQLNHPHIVGIHDFGSTDEGVLGGGGLYIAMEFLPGKTLAETVRAGGPLPWQRTVSIVRDVARALSAAHRRGVVHRDLKPENILLIEAEGLSDFVKVLDFGIAKLVRGHEVQGDELKGNLTGTGLVPGTPGYIAPEQITGSSDDARSDLYALGVTWFEMLTGRRPFEAPSAMKIFLAQLEQQAPRVSSAHPGVSLPPALDDLLGSLLEREPERRPASAEELLSSLREIPELAGAMAASHVETPVAGSLTLDVIDTVDALPPDEPTLPAVTTPAALQGVPPARADAARAVTSRSGTPSTGTSPSGHFVSDEEMRLRARKWRLRWAAAGTVIVLLVAVIIAGWGEGRFGALLDERMPLPVVSSDDNVRIELTNAIEAFYDGELDVANRAVEKVLRASPDEPGALLLKIALSGRMEDELAQVKAMTRLRELVDAGLPKSCQQEAGLLEAVVRSVKASAAGLRKTWSGCASCQKTGLGNLIFAGFFADRFAYDADAGMKAAQAAHRLLPRAALPFADEARFHLRGSAGDGASSALAVVERGLAINPESPLLHQVKAEAQLALGRYTDAARELRISLSMSSSPEADALLAQTLLLLDDEEGRRDVIEAALRRSTPHARATLAMHHGAVLVGAGRMKEAVGFYGAGIEAAVKSGTPADLAAAAQLALDALRAADAAHVAGELHSIRSAAERLLRHISLPRVQADVMKWVLHLVDGALAADRGDVQEANERLEQLKGAASELMPPQAHDGIVGYLTYRVYLADDAKLDEAERAADFLGHPCSVQEAKARVAAARGDEALARRRWQQLVAREGLCRLHSYGGVHTLNARAELIALDAKAGKLDDARAGLARLREVYPRADEDLPALVLARTAVGELAKAPAAAP